MDTKLRTGVAAVLLAAMAGTSVGCSTTPPSQNELQGLGNFIFAVIYISLCQANYGVCPFPIAPSDPPALAPVGG